MNTKFILAVALLSTIQTCSAEDDSLKYKGDRLTFQTNTHGKYTTEPKNEDNTICIPAKKPFRALSDLTSDGIRIKAINNHNGCDEKPIDENEEIQISMNEFKQGNANRYGLTYGAITVPFKYHVKNREFTSGGTVAPYIGYRLEGNTLGVGLKLVGFAGGAGVSIEQTIDGEKKTQTLAGLSSGIGLIGSIKDSIQVGLIAGWDHVSKSANYSENGKLWLALGIGFSFSN